MPRKRQPESQYTVKLSQAQRKVVAESAPALARRLKLDDRAQRAIPFTPAELQAVVEKARRALRRDGTGRGRIPLRHVFLECGQPLDQHRGATALPEEGVLEWLLAELRAIAGRYQWQYAAPDRQPQVEQIAHRHWQEEGCQRGRHEEHWRQAEKEFHADKPIRGTISDDAKPEQVRQLLSPWQAFVLAKTGEVNSVSSLAKLAEAGFPVTPGEAGAIEAAAGATLGDYSPALRAGIAEAVGLAW
jgi:hypothetical protein